jgi:thioredoxin-related protein
MLTLLLALKPAGTSQADNDSLDWVSLEEAQKAAVEDGKKIMVYVQAEWCGICRQVEEDIFPESLIQRLVERNYHPVNIDLDSQEMVLFNGEEMTEREFARRMNVSTTPTFLFINKEGKVLAHQVGYNPLARFAALLRFINSEWFGEVSFSEYLEIIG